MLIHREYASGIPARLIIEYGNVTTFNANRPHGFGLLNPETFAPCPKNPVIGAFFREIDRADELGSGMRKLMLYGKKYGGADPELIEGDVFRMIISVPEFGENPPVQPEKGEGKTRVETRVETQVETRVETTDEILALLRKHPEMTLAKIAEQISKSLSAVERASSKLVAEGRLKRIGAKKGGHWKVLK